MSQERAQQATVGANTADLALCFYVQLDLALGNKVGESIALEIPSDVLHRIELRCVWRQKDEFKSRSPRHQPRYFFESMGEKTVPHHDDWTANINQKLFKKFDAPGGVEILSRK